MELKSKIEAVLFFKGEPLSLKELAHILKTSEKEIEEAIFILKEDLKERGIVIMEKENEIMLAVSPEYSSIIKQLEKEELNKDLSKASLETLSIILYRNGANRAEIDYIRGVNSNFTLRALLVRGLVERIIDPKDNRRYIYKPTFELFSYMAISKIEELPDYDIILENIKNAEINLNDLNKEIENNDNKL